MSDSNTGARCKCKCGARLFWLLAAVLAVVAAFFARSCAKERRPAPQQPAPEPQTVEERVRARIGERVTDTNYMADLEGVSDRYGKLAALRAEAAKEFDEWRGAFLAAHPEALDLAAKVAEARASAAAEADALEARLKELFASDAKGAELLGKLEKIGATVEDNRRAAADYIGSRLRRQTAAQGPERPPAPSAAPPPPAPPAPARP